MSVFYANCVRVHVLCNDVDAYDVNTLLAV